MGGARNQGAGALGRQGLRDGHNLAAGNLNYLNLHTLHQVGEGRTPQDGGQPGADGVGPVPASTPGVRVDLAAPLNSADTHDQGQQDQEQN